MLRKEADKTQIPILMIVDAVNTQTNPDRNKQKCNVCQSQQIKGTQSCSNCGTSLREDTILGRPKKEEYTVTVRFKVGYSKETGCLSHDSMKKRGNNGLKFMQIYNEENEEEMAKKEILFPEKHAEKHPDYPSFTHVWQWILHSKSGQRWINSLDPRCRSEAHIMACLYVADNPQQPKFRTAEQWAYIEKKGYGTWVTETWDKDGNIAHEPNSNPKIARENRRKEPPPTMRPEAKAKGIRDHMQQKAARNQICKKQGTLKAFTAYQPSNTDRQMPQNSLQYQSMMKKNDKHEDHEEEEWEWPAEGEISESWHEGRRHQDERQTEASSSSRWRDNAHEAASSSGWNAHAEEQRIRRRDECEQLDKKRTSSTRKGPTRPAVSLISRDIRLDGPVRSRPRDHRRQYTDWQWEEDANQDGTWLKPLKRKNSNQDEVWSDAQWEAYNRAQRNAW